MPTSNANLSILSIPAYYVLAFLPHLYANYVASHGDLGSLEYSSPRSAKHIEGIKKNLSPERYARFERAKAASLNAYENAPLLVGAVLASHLAGVDKAHVDSFAVRFLLMRAAHSVIYIVTPGPKYYQVRSTCWLISMYLSFSILYEAAVKLA